MAKILKAYVPAALLAALLLCAQPALTAEGPTSDAAKKIAELERKRAARLMMIVAIYDAREEQEKNVPYVGRLCVLNSASLRLGTRLMKTLNTRRRLNEMLDLYGWMARACPQPNESERRQLYISLNLLCTLWDDARLRPRGRWEELLPLYERLVTLAPGDRTKQRGRADVSDGGFHGCVSRLGRCYVSHCNWLMRMGHTKGDAKEALDLLRAYRESCQSYVVYDISAQFLVRHGLLEEARTLLEDALAGEYKNDSFMVRDLAEVYAKLGRIEEAIVSYDTLIEKTKVSDSLKLPHYFPESRLASLCKQAGDFATIEKHAMRILTSDSLDVRLIGKKARPLLVALGSAGDEKYSELLMPYLEHPDQAVAGWVSPYFAAGAPDGYYSSLVLKALESDRPIVVAGAINGIRIKTPLPEVDARIHEFFEGDNEMLKIEACYRLIRFYDDEAATMHVLREVESDDEHIARLARSMWLSSLCNLPVKEKTVPEAVLEKARVMLSSTKEAHQRAHQSYVLHHHLTHVCSPLPQTEMRPEPRQHDDVQ